MTDLDRIRARIRQLRTMTTANGCTEAEALSAAEIAMRLMAEHGFSEDDIERATAARPAYQRRRTVVDRLWSRIAAVCRCVGYFERTEAGLGYRFYGTPADVAVAEYLHDLLRGAILRAAEEFKGDPDYRRRRKPATRSRAMRAFQVAMTERLCRRLSELWWLRVGENGRMQAAELKHLAKLGLELAERESLTALRPLDRKGLSRFGGALAAGWTAGGRVPIEPGVGAGERRLLK